MIHSFKLSFFLQCSLGEVLQKCISYMYQKEDTNKMLITFPAFTPESMQVWIIILTTGVYINTVQISCIQGCVSVLL
jgi:hypothetical protein